MATKSLAKILSFTSDNQKRHLRTTGAWVHLSQQEGGTSTTVFAQIFPDFCQRISSHKKNNKTNIGKNYINFKLSKVLVELEGDRVFSWGSDLISK